MSKLIRLVLAVSMSLPAITCFSQNITNKGKEFWVGYGHHQFMENNTNTQNMVIYLSAEEQPATVTITIDSSGIIPALWWKRTYNIPAYTVISIENPLTPAVSYSPASAGAFGPIPKGPINAGPSGTDLNFDARLFTDAPPAGTGGAGLFRKKGIHIQSSVPIVAYAHIYGSTSSGATMLLPVEAWGHSYISVNSRQSYASNCYSWMYVIAQKDNTVIEITPSVLTRAQNFTGLQPGVPKTVTLMKGQLYQVIGANDGADANGNFGSSSSGRELTGTKVRSIAGPAGECYPIAVFSGSSRTYNTITCGSGGGDNDNQQLFPVHAWGKKYVTAPFSGSSTPASFATSLYKVAVKDPSTVVRRNGTVLTGLIAGSYYSYESSTADFIEADKPIQVVQFMTGGGCLGAGGDGDPEMIVLSPLEQATRRVGFYRNINESIDVNYLTLVIPTAGVTSLRIDNSAVFSHTYLHPNLPGYTVVIKQWDPSSQAQCIVFSDSAFNAITYGLGSVESYGFNAGTNINNLNAIGSVHNELDPSVAEHPFTCVNTPVELSVLMAYQPTRLEWQLNTLAAVLTPSDNVIQNSPVSAGTVTVDGIPYFKYSLPGTYMFNSADTFTVSILATSPTVENCNNTEEIKINYIVKESPDPDFTFTHTGCTLDTVYFSGQNLAGGFTLGQWNWELPASVTLSGQDIKQVLPPGTHNIKLTGISSEGCVGDTIKEIIIHPKPTATFGITPPAVCLGQQVTLSDTSSYAGTSPPILTWYWDTGDGQQLNNPNSNDVVVNYAAPNTYTLKHVVKVSDLCISDTATKTVVISPKALIAFTYPTACLPATGLAQFTASPTDLGGIPIVSYNWDFGDPNATAGNPNTSANQNPSHTYSAYGTYPVTLNVVTNTGCAGDTTVDLTFSLQPALAYAPLAAVCESESPFSIADATVTNGVTGSGVYSGPGTDAAGIFDPAAAGPGTHTITYTFTSTGNCTETIMQDILVYARPYTAFIYPNGGCLPANGLVQFTNASTIADAQTLTWLWNFDDPDATAGNPNTSSAQDPAHNFSEGAYDITLTATSSNGCIKDTTITAVFSITPSLVYPGLAAICQNDAPVSVATAAVVNGVTGTGLYSGTGTTSAGMFDPVAAGPGTHTITYAFTSAGGCTETTTQNIQVYARPHAEFTLPASGCLPPGGLVQFTNASTISDGQTLTWLWDFNDPDATAGNPNTSAVQDPTHNFAEGTYTISLTATSSNGCMKDTAITATFALTPVLNYPTLPAICEGGLPVSIASATSNVAGGTGVYSGTGTSASGMFDPALAGPGTHSIVFTYTTAGGCVQSVSQNILVHARPYTNFTYPNNSCLPPGGQVQFTNASTIADGQPMTWAWDFDDPDATAGNPGTSIAQDPAHNFGEGSYDIQLTATSSNGCAKDTTITATFAVTPVLSYTALTGLCESAPAVSVDNASVTNGVTGNGVYSGPGTSAAGMFDPAVAGPGTHTITYTFTSTGGCTQTISSNIEVYPRPVASFTADMDICLNESATLSSTSTISSGTITAWNWNLGNGNTPGYNNANPFTVSYTDYNNYTVELVNVSDRACTSLPVTHTIAVHPLPQADFNLAAGICMPGGNAVFINQTSVPDNSALAYQWTFGDGGTGSTAVDPTHAYASTGSYDVALTATSAFGCADQVTKTISDFYDKPLAFFEVMPDEICQGADVVFNEQSTAPNSTIQSWTWNFDDNTTSTAQLPVKQFSDPGVYEVQLQVTNTVGCVSDPFIHAVTVHLQPVIDAGQSFTVAQNTTVQFTASANSSGLDFSWDPPLGLSDPTALKPTLVAVADRTYTLTATGAFGCTETDFITVKILKPVQVPNVFSPNGDNIHDKWMLPNLAEYPDCTVEIFNRYGQQVFYSIGYNKPWDGTFKGKEMPVGTYYYVIQLKNGFKPMTGPITIVR